MKSSTFILCILLGIITSVGAQQKTASTISPNALYQAGVKATNQGNLTEAQRYFTAAKAAQHPHADYQLSQLVQNRGKIIAKKRLFALQSIKIDKIDFTEVTLGESISFLANKITAANEEYIPNIVISDPENKLTKKLITLQLNQIPATVVLEQLLSSAGAKAKFEEHTIVIQPQ